MAKVLVVDDEPHILRLIEKHLAPLGHQVIGATDGYTALDLVQCESPDLIALDLEMPHINGWEVYRRLRANPQQASIPVILISQMSATVPRAALEAPLIAAGCSYLFKPFAVRDFLVLVDTILCAESPWRSWPTDMD